MIHYLIDANCAIYAMGGRHPALNDRLSGCEAGTVAISAISFAEVALGTHRGKPPPSDVLDAFIAAIPLLPFDEAAARIFGHIRFSRSRLHDRLLAAHALSLGATIVTNNEADFGDVPGLKTENWTQ